MSETNHLQLARDAYRAYETGDRDLIESLVAEDFVFLQPARSRARSRRLLRALLAERGDDHRLRGRAADRAR